VAVIENLTIKNMRRLLEQGEKIEAGDRVYNQQQGWVNPIGLVGTCVLPLWVIYREMPDEPQWRKVSEGPITFPCEVTDGKSVAISVRCFIGHENEPAGANTSYEFDKAITHWKPLILSAPPAPEKTEEEIAFEKWKDQYPITTKTTAEVLARDTWVAALAWKEAK
jgi:hypothetical protein